MPFPYRILRSRRKTIAVRIFPGGTLEVLCPLPMDDAAVAAFLAEKQARILKALEKMPPPREKITQQQLQDLKIKAKECLPKRVAHFAPLVGVAPGRITVRCQRSRWGSCSHKGNLNFNCLLMLLPEAVQDYVVVHELCHLKEMNHSARFWQLVENILPDWRNRQKILKTEGSALIAALPEA